ncbi:MAG: hypothetical protein HYV28_16115 [Ignavibacteriales bacterium]|nr:hypothetical protein [Ignavibacteriales bacterium]
MPENGGKGFLNFFTAKEIGEGIVLSLSISYSIIINNHTWKVNSGFVAG